MKPLPQGEQVNTGVGIRTVREPRPASASQRYNSVALNRKMDF